MGSRQDLRVTPTSLDIHFLTKASTTQTIHCRCDCNFVLESEIDGELYINSIFYVLITSLYQRFFNDEFDNQFFS